MEIKNTELQAYELLHEGALALAIAENNGMFVDVPYIKKKKKQITRKISKLQRDLEKTEFVKIWKTIFRGAVNFNSGKQLGEILYGKMGLTPPKFTKTGKGSTDESSLKQLNVPALNYLLQIKKLQKIRDTYLEGFLREQVNGYMHPTYHLHTVKTFRSSSSNPNFQNIPKRDKQAMKITRQAIKPRPGHQLVEFDFSKLEVSIAACYHKDPTMLNYLKSEHNDMHGDLAQQIFMIDDFDKEKHDLFRKAAKNAFIFPQFYGDWFYGNAQGLCEWVNLPEVGKWKKGTGVQFSDGTYISDHFISKGITEFGVTTKQKTTGFLKHLKSIEDDFWNNRFPVYGKWKKKQIKQYQRRGFVETLTGFRCRGEMRKNEVINYPVQGAAFHCLLWSFISITKQLQEKNMRSCIIGQIHDAIVFDIHPEELQEVADIVFETTIHKLPEHWGWIIVPLQIEAEICPVDGSWDQKKNWHEFNARNI